MIAQYMNDQCLQRDRMPVEEATVSYMQRVNVLFVKPLLEIEG